MNNIIKKHLAATPWNILLSTASQYTQHIQYKPCSSTGFWNEMLTSWVKTLSYMWNIVHVQPIKSTYNPKHKTQLVAILWFYKLVNLTNYFDL